MARKSLFGARVSTLRPVFNELNIPKAYLRGVARLPNVDRRIMKLRAMVEAGVPLTGLVFKLTLGEREFSTLLERFRSKYKFTGAQEKAFDFLVSKHMPEQIALGVVSNRNCGSLCLPSKVAFFESLHLAPARYGVSSIPPAKYAPLLHLPLSVLKRGIQKKLLIGLEDAHSRKVLDRNFPNWRGAKTFFPKGKKVRPTKILREIRKRLANRQEPRVDTIAYPSAARKNRAKFRGASKLLKGTKMSLAFRRSKIKRLEAIELEITSVNKQIAVLAPPLNAPSSEWIFVEDQIKFLKNQRSNLIEERLKLYFELST